MVRILRHDGELVQCGGKSNAPEAPTFSLSSYREDRRVYWVVNNEPAFVEDDFTVGVPHGPKTDQGMLELRHEFA